MLQPNFLDKTYFLHYIINSSCNKKYYDPVLTLDSGINIGVRLLIFGFFPGATSLLKRVIHKKNSEILLFDEVG